MGEWKTDRETLEREAQVSFQRAGGPGGQHRNKTETAVRLFHPPSGISVLASERRSREQNREAAFERLAARLRARNRKRKPRVKTKRPRAAEERRLAAKRRRSTRKQERKPPAPD